MIDKQKSQEIRVSITFAPGVTEEKVQEFIGTLRDRIKTTGGTFRFINEENVPTGLPESSPERQEFDSLFKEITGIDPDQAEKNEKGWLFMPLKSKDAPREKRVRLGDLAGPNGWKNHLVNDEYAGLWVRRPE